MLLRASGRTYEKTYDLAAVTGTHRAMAAYRKAPSWSPLPKLCWATMTPSSRERAKR